MKLLVGLYVVNVALFVLAKNETSSETPGNNEEVIGGNSTDTKKYPFVVQVRIKTPETEHYGFCGGSLITRKLVLTAAHCTEGKTEGYIKAGNAFLNQGQKYNISKIHQSPKYDKATKDFDVAILELSEEIPEDLHIAQFSNKSSEKYEGQKAKVLGWGLTNPDDSESISDELRVTDVSIFDRKKCEEIYKKDFSERMFCAGDEKKSKDACQGDSGGPLVVNENSESSELTLVLGIVSWGIGCGEPKHPGVYTDVSTVNDFIYDIIRKTDSAPE